MKNPSFARKVTPGLAASSLLVLTLAACGTALPPSELVTARESYARASHGPAAQYKPDELHEAKDRKSTRLNSSHYGLSRMPSSA